MPQMLAVQPNVSPSTPQARPSGSPGSNDQSHFSPHLENAVSGKKQGQQAPQTSADPKKSSDTRQRSQVNGPAEPGKLTKNAACTEAESSTETEGRRAEIADENSDQTNLLLHVPENIQQTSPSFLARQQPAEFHADQRNNTSAVIASEVPDFH